jgi:hypothetical protein
MLQFLVFPVATALIVLLGQFVIQPKIAARGHFEQTKWDARRQLYVRALELVNQKFASVSWSGSDVPTAAATAPLSPPPSRDQVNQVYAELALFSSVVVMRSFLACFGLPPGSLTAAGRLTLIQEMRNDLGLAKSDLLESDTFFFVKV